MHINPNVVLVIRIVNIPNIFQQYPQIYLINLFTRLLFHGLEDPQNKREWDLEGGIDILR